jgi:hypothetical protein
MKTSNTDRIQVIQTASALGVSEFGVFERAYRSWYREDAETRALESHFVTYLFHGNIPFWVRHYVREYCNEHHCQDAVSATTTCALLLQCLLWLGLRPPALCDAHEENADCVLQA